MKGLLKAVVVFLIVVFPMVALFEAVAVPGPKEPTTKVKVKKKYKQGFESYPLGPAPEFMIWSQGDVVCDVTDEMASEGTKSLHIGIAQDNPEQDDTGVYIWCAPLPSSNKFTVEFDVYFDMFDNWTGMIVGETTGTWAVWYWINGTGEIITDEVVSTLTPQMWYHVKWTIDRKHNASTIHVSGQQPYTSSLDTWPEQAFDYPLQCLQLYVYSDETVGTVEEPVHAWIDNIEISGQ